MTDSKVLNRSPHRWELTGDKPHIFLGSLGFWVVNPKESATKRYNDYMSACIFAERRNGNPLAYQYRSGHV